MERIFRITESTLIDMLEEAYQGGLNREPEPSSYFDKSWTLEDAISELDGIEVIRNRGRHRAV